MALFPGLSGWASTRKVKPIWILLEQETVNGSSIKSASRSRQITTPAPDHSVFYRPMPFLPTASKHRRQCFAYIIWQKGVHVCRLTELKTESRRRREQRETDAATLVAETKRRREIVERQFYAWNDGKKVDCSLVHTALRTYADMHDASLLLTRPLDPVDKHHSTFYLADYMKVHTHTHTYTHTPI